MQPSFIRGSGTPFGDIVAAILYLIFCTHLARAIQALRPPQSGRHPRRKLVRRNGYAVHAPARPPVRLSMPSEFLIRREQREPQLPSAGLHRSCQGSRATHGSTSFRTTLGCCEICIPCCFTVQHLAVLCRTSAGSVTTA